jgi:C4-dicarboxylate transporter DctQ subunit
MLFFVFSQVVARDLFHTSLYVIDELARYLMVAFCFLSGSLALRKNEFIGVTFAVDKLPYKYRRWVDLIALFSTLVFLFVGMFYGARLVVQIYGTGQLSPALQIPIAYAYLPIPIGFLFMFITSSISLYDLLINFPESKHTSDLLKMYGKQG